MLVACGRNGDDCKFLLSLSFNNNNGSMPFSFSFRRGNSDSKKHISKREGRKLKYVSIFSITTLNFGSDSMIMTEVFFIMLRTLQQQQIFYLITSGDEDNKSILASPARALQACRISTNGYIFKNKSFIFTCC